MANQIVSEKYIRTIEHFLEYTHHLILFIAYVIILVGIAEGVIFLIKNAFNDKLDVKVINKRTYNIIETRIKVLNSINLGIVFIIAGDIIKTLYMPNMINLFKVGVLICIREILSLFTHKEIQYLKKEKEDNLLLNETEENS